MQNYIQQQNGKIVSMWEGKNDTYWALIQYWIGSGYQYVERQTTKDRYEIWNL